MLGRSRRELRRLNFSSILRQNDSCCLVVVESTLEYPRPGLAGAADGWLVKTDLAH